MQKNQQVPKKQRKCEKSDSKLFVVFKSKMWLLFCPFYRHRKYGFSKIDFDKSIVKSAGSRNAMAFFSTLPFEIINHDPS